MRNKFFIATHKDFLFPNDPDFYPLVIGRNKIQTDLEFYNDDTGKNISDLNPFFCELTALYWMWKNLEETKYCGLFHYRRYFLSRNNDDYYLHGKKKLISSTGISKILESNQSAVIVAKQRNYFLFSVKSQYRKAHYSSDYCVLRKDIKDNCPDYLSSFDDVFSGKTISLYNMFCMNKALMDEYCEWLFPILFRVFEQVDTSKYSPYQKRFPGFMAERLFNVWLSHKGSNIKVIYRSVLNIDGENSFKKLMFFLLRTLGFKKI